MFDFLKKEKIISFSKIKNLKLINNNNFIEKTLILLFKNKKNPIKNKNSDFKKYLPFQLDIYRTTDTFQLNI